MDSFEMEAPMGGDIIRLCERIKALEDTVAGLAECQLWALKRQRAVNEALLAYSDAPGYEERNKRFDAVSAALREALK